MPTGKSLFINEHEGRLANAKTVGEARDAAKQIGRDHHISQAEKDALMGLARIRIAELETNERLQIEGGKVGGVENASTPTTPEPFASAPDPLNPTFVRERMWRAIPKVADVTPVVNINITVMAEGGKHAAYITREVAKMLSSKRFWHGGEPSAEEVEADGS